MSFELVPAGKSLPDDFNVVIEIPLNSSIKYEIDKDSNSLFVDRLVSTPMHYPASGSAHANRHRKWTTAPVPARRSAASSGTGCNSE